jgi:heme a synthase
LPIANFKRDSDLPALLEKSAIGNWKSAIESETTLRTATVNKGLHWFSLLVAGATFFLIIAGALVTSNDAGLATEDWPLSNGQVFPEMVGNLFWEHGHRMVATSVGLLTIGLVILLLWKEPRRWVRRLGVFGLFLVIAQGLLGGLTVKLMLPLAVSTAHATLAQIFFCTTMALAVFTSRSWITQQLTLQEKGNLPIRYVCLAATTTVFFQLILGATLRHSATWDKHLPTELVMAHIGGAIAVTIVLAGAAIMILGRYGRHSFLARPALVALVLLTAQLMLGVAAYLTRLASPNDPQPLQPMITITVAHVACGALVFATTIVLTLRTFKVVPATDSEIDLATSPQRV